MIPYEELVAALDRYVARNGGTPSSARVPASAGGAPAAAYAPPAAYDEPHDPDMPGLASHGASDDATHVGASSGGGMSDEHSQEIDIGDVLSDDELD
jgi:hypothetical protein